MKFSFGNISDNWKKWTQKFENYLVASEKNEKSDKTKIAILLNFLGDEGVEIFNTFKAEDGDKKKFADVMKMFGNYCSPRGNIVFERFKFFSCSQRENQPVENYITELKTLASSCEFGDQEEDLIRDRVVLGIRESALQERLLRETDLTLKKATDFLRAAEANREQMRAMKINANSAKLEEIGTKTKVHRPKQEKKPVQNSYSCSRCGKNHKKFQCPAFGKICAKCKKKNHFASMCKSNIDSRKKKVNEIVNGESDSNEHLNLIIDSVKNSEVQVSEKGKEKQWLKRIKVENNLIEFKLDTGAEVNVLPLNIYKKLNIDKKLENTNIMLVTYGNFKLKPEGKIVLNCICNERSEKLEFIVLNVESKPLLGLNGCIKFNLVKQVDQLKFENKDDVVKNYSDIFKGLGTFPGKPYHIQLNENIKPVVNPPRRVPLALHNKLKATLDELEKSNIISKVDEPTDWVNSLVIIEKPNGALRICLDPRDLNKAIKREHHIIPTADEIISNLEGKHIFSVLDLKDGFWQVPLDEESSNLCTFNSPFGRYKFKRMPFGIASAPEVFQKRNANLFSDIENVQVYFDDIIIMGSSEKEHDETLVKVLDRAKQLNIKFNPQKFQFKKSEVKYMGQIISGEGIQADPEQVRAVKEMEKPKTKKEVRRFLGMVNFLSKFIPNISMLTAPLRELLKDKVLFHWSEEHDKAFEKIKHLLCSAPVLKIFDSNKIIVIQCDSSKDGLGACLLQDNHPVSFVSRSLTETEQNYAQIEKEMLAITFAVKKYHNYIYGRKFIIHTDHKPLTSIVNKSISNISTRLQRLLIKLLKYQYEIKYVPGKLMYLADTLSRSYLKDKVEDDPEMMEVIHSLKYFPLSKNRMNQFKTATQEDDDLKVVYEYCKEGWPDKLKYESSNLKTYFKIKNDLYVECGLVMLNDKIVVPTSLRKEMLTLIHEGHFGMEKCKSRARESLYWPGMSRDIEIMVSKCEVCEKFGKANTKEPLIPHSIPSRPFEKIGIDILEFRNVNYLIIMDYYSKWLEIEKLSSKNITEIKQRLKILFSRFGIPSEIVSDNSPFNSYEFKEFAREWDFECIFVSPRYPQSNGMAEKAVGISKSILKKSFEDREEYILGLMAYRNTPISGINLSPSQIMFNRRVRTKLPISRNLLKPKLNTNIKEKLLKRQNKQKQYFDKGSKILKPLKPGDNVLIYNFDNKTWEPAQVINKTKNPRSYVVKTKSGRILIRNRKYLKSTLTPYKMDYDYDFNIVQKMDKSNSSTSVQNINNNSRPKRNIRKPAYLNNYIC